MFHFVPNLKSYTFYRGRGNRRFDSYLLSADYYKNFSKLAKKVVAEDRILVADNGNFDLIKNLINQNKSEAKILDTARKKEEKSLGVRYARPGQLSVQLRSEYQNFAHQLTQASKASIDEHYIRATVSSQLEMEPSYIIGMEDFTIACMTGLSMEPEYTELPLSFYESLNDRAINFADETKHGKYGPCSSQVFATLHAIDYDTAHLAGSKAAQSGVDGIATGLVGALRDKNFVDFRVKDGVIIELPSATPRPYMRTLEIITGFHQGYREHAGKNPNFHVLGAGTPILLPLIGLLGDEKSYLCSDSTAPIVDGWISPTTSLYIDEPAPLKLKAYRIAQYWIEEGKGWDCHCPYCRKFTSKHPPNLSAAKTWWVAEGRPKLTKYSLYRDSPLSIWLPILSNSNDPVLQKEAALTRVAHNHWIIKRIESQIRLRQTDRTRLKNWVENVMSVYMESCASAKWKASAEQAWKIANSFELNM